MPQKGTGEELGDNPKNAIVVCSADDDGRFCRSDIAIGSARDVVEGRSGVARSLLDYVEALDFPEDLVQGEERVLAGFSLAGEHDPVGAVENGVADVGNFSSRRPRNTLHVKRASAWLRHVGLVEAAGADHAHLLIS